MTREQAQVANNRILVLEDRIRRFQNNLPHWGINPDGESSLFITMVTTITEFELEIAALRDAINTRHEWLFNFAGGGWNSVTAYTREEAILLAKAEYSELEPDEGSFRQSTTSDRQNLLSVFH